MDGVFRLFYRNDAGRLTPDSFVGHICASGLDAFHLNGVAYQQLQ